MDAAISLKEIAWKRILFFLLLILIPNYLLMQVQITGWVSHSLGLATAIDLTICLPLIIYFFGFRKRVSILVLIGCMFCGLLLANWMIPNEADGYLSYFNNSFIALEAGIIASEVFIFIIVLKKLPLFIKKIKKEQKNHFHFLLSFSAAIRETFSFENKKLNKFQLVFRILATDISAVYYSLFSWKKKPPIMQNDEGKTFTMHKDGAYLGVFFMLVHAMAIEIVGVHMIIAQFDTILAWVVTVLDIYLLLFIIADYQAIRLSPVVVDSKGLHFQKGIRQYGFVPLNVIQEINENTKSIEEIKQDKKGFSLAIQGIEKERIPHVIELKKPIKVYQFFGYSKKVESIYIKVDDVHEFNVYMQKVENAGNIEREFNGTEGEGGAQASLKSEKD